jgi:transposase
MLIVETIGRIRREHFVKGKSIKEIARDLKISRNTVRKVLRSDETSFSYEREVQPRPKLGRWKAEIDRMLARNAGAAARERLTLIRLFEELQALGYEGGYDTVRRYAKSWVREKLCWNLGDGVIRARTRRRESIWPFRPLATKITSRSTGLMG